jgi:hypothetical protein
VGWGRGVRGVGEGVVVWREGGRGHGEECVEGGGGGRQGAQTLVVGVCSNRSTLVWTGVAKQLGWTSQGKQVRALQRVYHRWSRQEPLTRCGWLPAAPSLLPAGCCCC